MTENFGRMQSASAAVLSRVFSLVMMAFGEPSLPEAAMVNTTPTGRAVSGVLPAKKSQKSPS